MECKASGSQTSLTFELFLPTPDEIAAALLRRDRIWHRAESREQATRACVEHLPSDAAPTRVPLRVTVHRGSVYVRWGPNALTMDREERRLYHCLQDVLGYGDLPHHFEEHEVDVLVHRDGRLSLAPNLGPPLGP